MPDTRDSLDFLKRMSAGPTAEAKPVTEEEEDLGPCVSRVTTKWWPGFHVKRAKLISKKGPSTLTTRSFDYSHMGYREFDPGNAWFVVEVNEPEKWRIRVEGRALWKLYNYVHQHRLEWIEPVAGNAAMGIADGVPVIERITIERIEDGAEE
jgi:hypothetical protein